MIKNQKKWEELTKKQKDIAKGVAALAVIWLIWAYWLISTKKEKRNIVVWWSFAFLFGLFMNSPVSNAFIVYTSFVLYVVVLIWGIFNLHNRWGNPEKVSAKQRFLNKMTKSPIHPKLDKVHQIVMILGFVVIVVVLTLIWKDVLPLE